MVYTYEKLVSFYKCEFEKDFSHFLQVPVIPRKSLYIQPTGSDYDEKSSVDLHKEIEQLLLKTNERSIVLTGCGGAGKTSFALEACNRLWKLSEESNDNAILPIYINLPYTNYDGHGDLLHKFVSSRKLSCVDEDLKKLTEFPECVLVVLILDGYNEMKCKINLWDSHQNWKENVNMKLVTLLRPEVFSSVNEMKEFFAFTMEMKGQRKRRIESRIFEIETCNQSKIEAYTSAFVLYLQQIVNDIDTDFGPTLLWPMTIEMVKENPKWCEDENEYKLWVFQKHPVLMEIGKTPFLLQLILQVLPVIVSKSRKSDEDEVSTESNLTLFCRNETELFDSVVYHWCEFQYSKPKKSDSIKRLAKNDLINYYISYMQNLAVFIVEQNNGLVENLDLTEKDSLKFRLLEPSKYEELMQLQKPNGEYFAVFPTTSNTNLWTDEQKENFISLRDGALIKSTFKNDESKNQIQKCFRFLHHSFVEYFASREIFEGIRSELNYYLLQNINTCPANKLLQFNVKPVEEFGPKVFEHIVSQARISEEFCECLLHVVRASAEVAVLKQMASNAITVLNHAGKSLSGLELREVQIPNANLSQCVCVNTDFSGANLSGVNFQNSLLTHSNFSGANLEDVNFGMILPPKLHETFDASKSIDSLCAYSNSQEGIDYIIYTHLGKVYKTVRDFAKKQKVVQFQAPPPRKDLQPKEDLERINIFIVKREEKCFVVGCRLPNTIFIWNFEKLNLKETIEVPMTMNMNPEELKSHTTNFDLFSTCFPPYEYEEKEFPLEFQCTLVTFKDVLVSHQACVCEKDEGKCKRADHRFYPRMSMHPWSMDLPRIYSRRSYCLKVRTQVLNTNPVRGLIAFNFYGLDVRIVDTLRRTASILCVNDGSLSSYIVSFSGNGDTVALFSEGYWASFEHDPAIELFESNDLNKPTRIGISRGRSFPNALALNYNGSLLVVCYDAKSELDIVSLEKTSHKEFKYTVLNTIHHKTLYRNGFPKAITESWVNNFCFFKEDEFIAHVNEANTIQLFKIGSAVKDPVSKQSWVQTMTVSHDAKFIALNIGTDVAPGMLKNLQIYSTPIQQPESFVSSTRFKPIHDDDGAIMWFPLELHPRRLIVLKCRHLTVYLFDMQCQILTEVQLEPGLVNLPSRWIVGTSCPENDMVAIFDKIAINNFSVYHYKMCPDPPYISVTATQKYTFDGPEMPCKGAEDLIVQELKATSDYVALFCNIKFHQYYLQFYHLQSNLQIKLTSPDEDPKAFTFYSSCKTKQSNSQTHNVCIALGTKLIFRTIKVKRGAITAKKGRQSIPLPKEDRNLLSLSSIGEMIVLCYTDGTIRMTSVFTGKKEPATILTLWHPIIYFMKPSSMDDCFYVTGGLDEVITFLRVDNTGSLKLEWTSGPCTRLNTYNCNIRHCYLGLYNSDLLKSEYLYLKATGNPIVEDVARSNDYVPLCNLLKGIVDHENARIREQFQPIIRSKQYKDETISDAQWAVSAVVKKRSKLLLLPHMGLVIEGIRNSRRFALRADLQKDKNRRVDQVTIRTKSLDKIQELDSLAQEFDIEQYFVSSDDGMKLVRQIRQDQRMHRDYNLLKGNCKTWTANVLKTLDITLEEKWFDIVVHYPKIK